jgi:very-short-patch-repair endonuclease
VREGIPVTGLVRTFVDLAAELGPRRLERAVNDADKLDLIDPESLWEALDRYGGEPGVRRLRAILDPRSYRPSDSNLEILFRSIAASAGLPLPLTQQRVNGFRVDFYWPGLGLVVETDSLRYHRTPAEQQRDHLRDQAHTAAGLSPLRFTESQVKEEPDYVRRILIETVRLQEKGRITP